jgi:hypothetical protein
MLVGRMPDMPMQELSTVLHVATEWQLSCKQQLAEAAAALVAAAAGVPVVVAASGSSDGDDDASAGSLRRRQQQQPQGGFVSAILLQTADALGEQLLQVKQQAAAHRAGDAAAGTGSDDADGASTAAVLTATHQKLQRVQKHIARWRTVLAPVRITTSSNGSSSSSSVRALLDAQPRRAQQCRPLRGMLPRNVADAVVLLHRFCCCGYKPHPGLLGFLLRAAGQELHSMSLLQVPGGGGARGGGGAWSVRQLHTRRRGCGRPGVVRTTHDRHFSLSCSADPVCACLCPCALPRQRRARRPTCCAARSCGTGWMPQHASSCWRYACSDG